MAEMPQTEQVFDRAVIRIAAMYPFAFPWQAQKTSKAKTTKTIKV